MEYSSDTTKRMVKSFMEDVVKVLYEKNNKGNFVLISKKN